jgi:hypothetical protein
MAETEFHFTRRFSLDSGTRRKRTSSFVIRPTPNQGGGKEQERKGHMACTRSSRRGWGNLKSGRSWTGCPVQALADNVGFCMPCFTTLVPPWEQCTSAATVTLWLPEGHITGEVDLALPGSDCVCVSLILGILLFAHIETFSESEFSDEELSRLHAQRGPQLVFRFFC